MASELTYTGHGNLFIAAALNRALWETIVDRTDISLTNIYMGSVNGQGSVASKIAQASFDDAMGAANGDETTAIGNTDLGNSTVTITVARQALKRVVTDIYQLVGGPRPGVERFAADMVNAAQLRYTDMVCALFTSLSSSVGTSGANMTLDDLYDALYALIRARASGKRYAVLAPIQFTDLMDSLRGEGLSITPPDANSILASAGDTQGWGLAGTFAGCEIWSSDSCATNGADKEGAVYTQRCFGYQDGVPSELLQNAGPGSFISAMPSGSPIFVEFQRLAAEAHTLVVGNYYVGVSEMEDANGVKIVTSAS